MNQYKKNHGQRFQIPKSKLILTRRRENKTWYMDKKAGTKDTKALDKNISILLY